MTAQYRGYLSVLAHTKKVVVFDDSTATLKTHPHLLELFESYNCYSVNDITDTHLSTILTRARIDVVIIESADPAEVVRLSQHITRLDWRIALIVIVPEGAEPSLYREANSIADTMICRPLTEETLIQKMVTALAAKQTMTQLSLSLGLESLLADHGDIETFKRTFEGNILLLCDVLQDQAQRLENGELSPELFNEVADDMEKIAKIFGHHHYTGHVAKTFDNFALYLRNFNFNTIDISTIEGFNYLTRIVEDITTYVKDFFVNRIFSDVYVFEHSLENSIEFMKNTLEKREDTQSEMEFFE